MFERKTRWMFIKCRGKSQKIPTEWDNKASGIWFTTITRQWEKEWIEEYHPKGNSKISPGAEGNFSLVSNGPSTITEWTNDKPPTLRHLIIIF